MTATAQQITRHCAVLRELAAEHGLGNPRLTVTGACWVDDPTPGYWRQARFALDATKVLGAHPVILTDEVPAGRVDAEPL